MFVKNKLYLLLIAFITCAGIFSCQKDLDYVVIDGQLPDLSSKTNSSVSGFVTDENNAAVLGASVSVGNMSATTDKYGFFEVKNVQVVRNAAMVTVNKPGYFKGIKTYIATENKAAFFRIKLIPKTNSGTINATSGGNVSLSNGLIVALPANAVVNAATASAYSGTVNVSSHWIDPTATDLHQTMPGDLRGIATDGSLKTLTTFGMAAVELTGASGELLQIAPGKKATLTLSIPAAIQGNAPANIPLWSFDESIGLWEQEGQATKTGNTYVGEVSHFSFWNCDVPNNYVIFNCTVKDTAGNPIPYTLVKISETGSPFNAGYGYTDGQGFVSGAIPSNASLLLEVYASYACPNPVHSQAFTSTNSNISFGTVTVNAALSAVYIKGMVTDCSNNPVTNGRAILFVNQQYFASGLLNGGYNFGILVCNNATTNVTVIGEDFSTQQQSNPFTTNVVVGSNTTANLQACANSIQQYITYSIDGGTMTTFAPPDSLYHSGNGTTMSSTIGASNFGTNSYVSFSFVNSSIAVGSIQNMMSFTSSQISFQTSVSSPATVSITEYGVVGQFIAGSFTANIVNTAPPTTTHTVAGTFRVRRSF